jgi:hypothetical protein
MKKKQGKSSLPKKALVALPILTALGATACLWLLRRAMARGPAGEQSWRVWRICMQRHIT